MTFRTVWKSRALSLVFTEVYSMLCHHLPSRSLRVFTIYVTSCLSVCPGLFSAVWLKQFVSVNGELKTGLSMSDTPCQYTPIFF